MWKSRMHREGHSNTARCSLEPELDKIDQDRIYDLQGTAALSLTVLIVAGFGLVTCLSLACCVTVFVDVDGIDAGGIPCGFCKVMTSSLGWNLSVKETCTTGSCAYFLNLTSSNRSFPPFILSAR